MTRSFCVGFRYFCYILGFGLLRASFHMGFYRVRLMYSNCDSLSDEFLATVEEQVIMKIFHTNLQDLIVSSHQQMQCWRQTFQTLMVIWVTVILCEFLGQMTSFEMADLISWHFEQNLFFSTELSCNRRVSGCHFPMHVQFCPTIYTYACRCLYIFLSNQLFHSVSMEWHGNE